MPRWLVAQAPPGLDTSWIESLGALGGIVVICLAVIAWLIRDRARIIADRDAERAITRAITSELSGRLVDHAERTTPVLDRTARALEAATLTMDRLDRERPR